MKKFVKLDPNKCMELNTKIRDKCLICGVIFNSNRRSNCEEKCGFCVHKTCLVTLRKLKGDKADTDDTFKCNYITVQSTPDELRKIVKDVSSSKRKAFSNQHKVIPTNYSRKRKRYTNDLLKCDACKELIEFDTCDHILSWCTALNSSPVKKRSRRNYKSDGFRKRILEFTLLEKNDFEKIDRNERSNFMVP